MIKRPQICKLNYLLAVILLAGFVVGVFYLKARLLGASIVFYKLPLGMTPGFIIGAILIRLKKHLYLICALVVLEIIWFAIPWEYLTITTVVLGCGCSCGICAISYIASLLSHIRKTHSY